MASQFGVVMRVNRQRGLSVAYVIGRGYVVVETSRQRVPQPNDEIQGHYNEGGWREFQNATTGATFDGYVHMVGMPMPEALTFIS